jgi:hypothetical protein
MKFKELTDEHIQAMEEIFLNGDLSWDERMDDLKEITGKSERTTRKWLIKLDISKTKEEISPQYEAAKKKKVDRGSKRFLVTWGQCDTTPHGQFMDNLEAYAKHLGADIHVIAGRYKNPNSLLSNDRAKSTESWHSRLVPYLDANRHNIHKYLSILSDIKTQPTAVNPMSGLQGVSAENSCIFGSPKLQMEMIPVLEGNKPKMMMTTGACTLKNYTDSKAGKKGEFHHTIGFVVVEIEDKNTFHIRQVSATDDGNFIDLYYEVNNGKVSRVKECSAIVLGDLHAGHHDQKVIDRTLKLMEKVKPEHTILHDVFDGRSISHHEAQDPFIQYAKEYHGLNDLGEEIEMMMDVMEPFTKYPNVVIVRSNHDDFLDRWLKLNDWRKQSTPKNNKLYMKFSQMLMTQYEETPHNILGVIPELIQERYPKFITLGRGDSYKVNGWELGHHGDYGANGSRGSLQQFRKLNTKIVVGHYHSCQRKDGALAVGTSTHLRVGYNQGASGWLNSHVVIHKNGKAQHVNFVGKNKNYTTLK